MKFKVGDIVVANSSSYGCTNKANKWVGKVTNIYGDNFSAKTIFSKRTYDIGDNYPNLWDKHFITLNEAIKEGVEIEI